jgi:hypothetical protein
MLGSEWIRIGIGVLALIGTSLFCLLVLAFMNARLGKFG